MRFFVWDDAKNAKLRRDRGTGFEEIVFHIEREDLLDILAVSHMLLDTAPPAINVVPNWPAGASK